MRSAKSYQSLSVLREQIESPKFPVRLRGVNNWGGADVIITDKPLLRQTSKTVFVTRHAKPLSWLFCQLRDYTLLAKLIEKHEFYGGLAMAACEYQNNHPIEQDNPQGLLMAVLEEAEWMLTHYSAKLFVYGTLMAGESNHWWLKGAEFLGSDELEDAQLFNLGAYPMLLHGDGMVVGELYQISLQTVQLLDQLEGHPDYFQRNWVTLKSGRAALVYQGRTALVQEYSLISNGLWRERA